MEPICCLDSIFSFEELFSMLHYKILALFCNIGVFFNELEQASKSIVQWYSIKFLMLRVVVFCGTFGRNKCKHALAAFSLSFLFFYLETANIDSL